MGRTCEPVGLAARIIQAVSRMADRRLAPQAWEEAARREFDRYTFGLHDFERQEVMASMAAQLRGRCWQ
jgi:hypothetical protein